MLNLFKKKVIKEEKGLKLSKVGTRPKDDEIEKTLKLKELPKYFREVDPYLVSEINDILKAPPTEKVVVGVSLNAFYHFTTFNLNKVVISDKKVGMSGIFLLTDYSVSQKRMPGKFLGMVGPIRQSFRFSGFGLGPAADKYPWGITLRFSLQEGSVVNATITDNRTNKGLSLRYPGWANIPYKPSFSKAVLPEGEIFYRQTIGGKSATNSKVTYGVSTFSAVIIAAPSPVQEVVQSLKEENPEVGGDVDVGNQLEEQSSSDPVSP
jgi:hypothetical protein